MTFIVENKKLLNQLLKLAQNPTSIQPDPSLNFSVLENLIDNLEDKITANSYTSDRDNTNLFTKDLENAYNFLHFLARNGIKNSEYQFLSIPHRPGQLEKEMQDFKGKVDLNKYFKYPKPSSDDADDFRFYVHKDGVIDFLRTLNQRSSQPLGGDLLRLMVGKVISEIEENSGQVVDPSKASPGQTGTGTATNQPLQDQIVLDGIPNPVDPNNPYEPGSIPLTVGDLKNDSTFKSWTAQKQIKIKLQGQPQEAYNKQNICSLISVLLERAERYKDYYSKDNQAKQMFEYYFKQISTIASQNKCSINSTNKSDKDKNKEDKSKDKKPGSGGNINFDQLIKYLPLRTDVINLNRINTYFNFVENNIAESTPEGEFRTRINQMGSEVVSLAQEIKQMVNPRFAQSADNFSLNLHPNDIIDYLGNNYRQYNEFLSKYMQIVQITSDSVSLLMQSIENQISDATLYYLRAQCGYGGNEASSIAYQNKSTLRQYSANITQAIRTQQNAKTSRFM